MNLLGYLQGTHSEHEGVCWERERLGRSERLAEEELCVTRISFLVEDYNCTNDCKVFGKAICVSLFVVDSCCQRQALIRF